jgi:hypothetical protein
MGWRKFLESLGLVKVVRCRRCRKPLRGKWAKMGIGPACLNKELAVREAIG